MSENFNAIHDYLKRNMENTYPSFPFVLHTSPDDDTVLCMLVFAVPAEQVEEVKTFVRSIRENEVVGNELLVLPMIKNLEVTREYYPEYLPKQTPSSYGDSRWFETGLKTTEAKWFFKPEKSTQNNYTEQLSFDFLRFAVCIGSKKENAGFNQNKSVAFDFLNGELQLAA